MKKLTILTLLLLTLLNGCSETIVDPGGTPTGKLQLFILNEGSFQKNNSSLNVWSYDDSTIATNVIPGLGDTGSDIELIDGKIYIVVSGSAKLVVTNPDLSGQKSIQFEAGSGPSRITKIDNNRALLTFLYRPYTALIDITADTVLRYLDLGTGSRGLAVYDGKVYVANDSDGVSIIDIPTLTVEHRSGIIIEPYDVIADSTNGNIIVVGVGDFNRQSPPELIWIRASDRSILKKITFTMADYFPSLYPSVIGTGELYLLFGDRVASYSLTTRTLVNDTFIPKGFYGGMFDKITNRLILGDDKDFISQSIVSFYSPSGDSLYTMNAGILPAHFTIYKKP